MEGILLGFSIVAVLIAVGALIAAVSPVVSERIRAGLTPLVYYLTNPCLMVVLVSQTDVRSVAGIYAPIALTVALLTGALFAVFGVLTHRRAGEVAVGSMASSYVNAGNIGVPVALYVVGSTAPVVAVLLAQLLVLAPLYLTIFGVISRRAGASDKGSSGAAGILASLFNPTTVGVLIGGLLSLTGRTLPAPLWEPLRMVGEASIPLMLMIFGMALWKERPFTVRNRLPDTIAGLVCKSALMPCIAWFLAGPVWGLNGTELLGVIAMAALPTAQNVYLFGAQHKMPLTVTKDIIFASSFLSLPVTLAASWLLAMG
ncbi:AEC family transporter [Nesterenkonia flava]|uniref:AEC family transporter n=1 Tax=Nesterenkonia flava TaxID=469799 RepID=A0ABU1FSY0_9MICC|nr:AEC family transporter [Nesterenkonia flava]MDR5711749.1 AEC family transporter [Nesterenkonia flava]